MSKILLAITLAGAASSPTVYGYGSDSCGQWLEARSGNQVNALAASSWLSGYVSAVGVAQKRDALNGKRMADAEYWVEGYCRDNPQRKVVLAVEAMLAAFRRP